MTKLEKISGYLHEAALLEGLCNSRCDVNIAAENSSCMFESNFVFLDVQGALISTNFSLRTFCFLSLSQHHISFS